MMIKRITLFCVISVGLISCLEKNIELTDFGDPVPVINGLLTHDEAVKIAFFYSIPSAGTHSIEYLHGAKVAVFEEGEFWDSLYFDSNESVYISDKLVQEDKLYSIQLFYKDEKLTAETRVPKSPSLILVDTFYNVINPHRVIFEAKIDISGTGNGFVLNKPELASQYQIDMMSVSSRRFTNFSIENIFVNTLIFAEKRFDLIEINDAQSSNSALFTTQQHIVDRSLSPPRYDSTIFELHALSEEFYNYIMMPSQVTSNMIEVTEDYPVAYSNIKGGTGIFAGYSKGFLGVRHHYFINE